MFSCCRCDLIGVPLVFSAVATGKTKIEAEWKWQLPGCVSVDPDTLSSAQSALA